MEEHTQKENQKTIHEDGEKVSFTINGAFIANAIAAYGKMEGQLEEDIDVEFNTMIDEGDKTYSVYCIIRKRVLN